MKFRELNFEEVNEIWSIDRSEYIDSIYVINDGKIEEKQVNINLIGWPPGDREIYQPILEECFRSGGAFYGGFDNDRLIAILIVDLKPIKSCYDQTQLKFLYIDKDYRGKGIAKELFLKAVEIAKKRGFKKLYISSCESKNTVEFYKHMGCSIAKNIDHELFKLEPEDIHMEYTI